MKSLSSVALSAYTDLVRLLRDDQIADIFGTPTRKMRGSKSYWYAVKRIGRETRFVYIGEDSAEVRAQIDRLEELRATAKDRQTERARLV
ncbi:hypothetical protein [Pontivivens insulae]|uniref:DUF6788 domain-containing protein n=1 Tax=Pontivivens insulae TaxID=1639689 RepID=A0A2R8AGI4_9RHOB|nr:hypothetical protein [Pontivivens insulae]RED10609.1 hypothetical protein DFR53_3545 [Pontivivens insulae]SPF31180.1 hypothetical protein POI8812_03531 [Pontivivens insulae]